ncbi:DUF2269 family protein [Cohnella candidum]|uniref:DUF2269 family protein n=1 Tax=Cohnella candidum TaxID=2674991 RepID=A0A3G3K2J1_9BACL|nr:DUF2269 family protein [Cohnella candidum]AYQ74744.1 DUF2269 family protein [Cohnella candidum]
MNGLFGWLLVIHVLAAFAVIGPALVVPVIRRSARTAGQLRYAFDVSAKLAFLPKIGGVVLIATGVWLMIESGIGFTQMWLNLSILLSLLLIVLIDAMIEPRVKKIMRMMSENKQQGDEIPREFTQEMRTIVPFDSVAQAMMIAIIVLMVLKPF